MRRVALRACPPADHSSEPGFREWKTPTFGRCAVCGTPGLLVRHHVVAEQHIRAAHGDPWDQRNALALGAHCSCHRAHHQAAARISVTCLPDEAVSFAAELLGAAVGAYLSRYYAP